MQRDVMPGGGRGVVGANGGEAPCVCHPREHDPVDVGDGSAVQIVTRVSVVTSKPR